MEDEMSGYNIGAPPTVSLNRLKKLGESKDEDKQIQTKSRIKKQVYLLSQLKQGRAKSCS